MKLFYCPTCSRVFFLDDASSYFCGRAHATTTWSDGKSRRFVISGQKDTSEAPWPIPPLVEEREIYHDQFVESWVDSCPNPGDIEFGDVRRHFGFGAPGGRHLTVEQAIQKYSLYVLRPVEETTPEVPTETTASPTVSEAVSAP